MGGEKTEKNGRTPTCDIPLNEKNILNSVWDS